MVVDRPSRKSALEGAPPPKVSRAEWYLKLAIVAGLAAGFFLSPRLWFGERLYPLTPVWNRLPAIPAPADSILYFAIFAMLAAIAFMARPAKWIGVFALAVIVLALCDQSRWQPWLYQYLVMLAAVGFYDFRGRGKGGGEVHPALDACRLIIVCIYCWSGLQKIHSDFFYRVFPWLIEPFTHLLPAQAVAIANSFGFVVPLIEFGIGIGLLVRRFREYAVYAAIGMHAFILLAIGPLGRNYNNVVWPWNIAMICFLIVLFRKQPILSARQIVWPRGEPFHALILLLFGIAPFFSFFNAWDDYLSSALYSGYRNEPVLYVKNSLADRLPKPILACVYLTDKPGMNVINLLHWSLNELNVVNYPEPRVYKNVARYICSYVHEPSEMKLVIKRTHMLFLAGGEESYGCPALLN